MNMKEAIKTAIANTGTEIEPAMLEAFIAVESGGRAFDPATGKIMIQFEPHKFKDRAPDAKGITWPNNKIDVQSKEWPAFNEAFAINPNAAMESTSIGLPQIMGFHWKRLGYSSVGAMWDDFKQGVVNQIEALITFIETDRRLMKAMIEKDWHMIAYIYNGSGYAALAHRLGREPYNISLEKAYRKLNGNHN